MTAARHRGHGQRAATSLLRGTVGEIAAEPGGTAAAAALLAEAQAVPAAAGYPLPRAEHDATLAFLTRPGAPTTSSLSRDLLAGRPTEAEQILGDLTRRAPRRASGRPSPTWPRSPCGCTSAVFPGRRESSART